MAKTVTDQAKEIEEELESLKDPLPEVIEALCDMVNQHCSSPGRFYVDGSKPDDENRATVDCALDSMALSANADAIRVLAKMGKVKIEAEYGRRVGANWIEVKP